MLLPSTCNHHLSCEDSPNDTSGTKTETAHTHHVQACCLRQWLLHSTHAPVAQSLRSFNANRELRCIMPAYAWRVLNDYHAILTASAVPRTQPQSSRSHSRTRVRTGSSALLWVALLGVRRACRPALIPSNAHPRPSRSAQCKLQAAGIGKRGCMCERGRSDTFA